MSVEVRPDKTANWTKTVFIDGVQLRLQCCEDPIIDGDICIVRCLTDKKINNSLDPKTVPYQVKPYRTEIAKDSYNNGREVTTFYLKL